MKKKLLSLVINIILMGLVLVLVVFGVFRGIDKFTRHGEYILVPDVQGLSVAEAESVFQRQGLTCVIADSIYVKDEAPGRILDYLPAKGDKVKQGRIIYLTINTQNIPQILVPDVADNSSARQARAKMSSVGFKLTDDEYISGQKDWVYEVKYKGVVLPIGAKAPVGATLTLVIGDGATEIKPDSLAIELNRPELHESNSDDSWFE